MPSLIPGYEYDIFISYRQKDNKGDRWVSELVESLKTELESTFKEEISVYFDNNPHDGLLETHDVYESLKEKLKCLIFIPIISRTYCDPKSFAWEHEFKAFVELASQDQYGLKVKLPNGNVASRVLPVQIHDLKVDDKTLVEKTLGGFLRSIEFIYSEPGVNKPLTNGDDDKKNLNGTKYRIQINKVANSVDEIISALKAEPDTAVSETDQPKDSFEKFLEDEKRSEVSKPVKPVKPVKSKLLSAIAVLAILIITGILAYPKIFKRSSLEKLKSSGEKITVAVMPFQNMTNDTTWNIWQSGIQDMLITNLSSASDELRVRQIQSINGLIGKQVSDNYASLTPALGSVISQKLNANIYVYGNIKQAGSVLRIYAQLIDTQTEEVFKSFQIESVAEEGNIFNVIDSLSGMVRDFLIISELIKEAYPVVKKYQATTRYPEALKYFLNGKKAYSKYDYRTAIDMYKKAIAIDSTYLWPAISISYAYLNLESIKEGREWCRKIYEKRDQMPEFSKIYANIINAYYNETPYEVIKYSRQLLEIDDQIPSVHFNIGNQYNNMLEYSKAIPEYEKTLEIHKEWGIKPVWVLNYTYLGDMYHKTGQYKKEEKLYEKAEEDFPGNIQILINQTILQLAEKDTMTAKKSFEKLLSLANERSIPEAAVAAVNASIYYAAGYLDKAEEYYRKAFSLEPNSQVRINSLAWFLVDNDRNINEGLALADSILISSPTNIGALDTKGWGLYKLGKYQDAMEILQKGWDLRKETTGYDHAVFLRLEAAKKANASQKNN